MVTQIGPCLLGSTLVGTEVVLLASILLDLIEAVEAGLSSGSQVRAVLSKSTLNIAGGTANIASKVGLLHSLGRLGSTGTGGLQSESKSFSRSIHADSTVIGYSREFITVLSGQVSGFTAHLHAVALDKEARMVADDLPVQLRRRDHYITRGKNKWVTVRINNQQAISKYSNRECFRGLGTYKSLEKGKSQGGTSYHFV